MHKAPMKSEATTPKSIDAYIAGFPREVQALLRQVRATIREAAPDAEEAIKYQLPTLVQQGNLVHFGAFKSHIGFYPGATGIEKFQQELSAYTGAKGSVQFPLDQPLPLELITRIVKFRIEENLALAAAKQGRKPA